MDLAERLRERRAEIEQATLARVYAVADPDEVEDPAYAVGLREAVAAALDYAIAAIEAGADRREPAPIPDRLLAQARAAARSAITLHTGLRRYSVGYTLLGDFMIGEIGESPIPGTELKRALRAQAAVYDRLIATISTEYAREAEGRMQGVGHRRAERVRMLLAGEPVDPGELRYELDAWHLATIASGPGAVTSLREIAATLDRSLLLVQVEEGVLWAWLGGRARLSSRETLRLASQSLPSAIALALGEPGQGVEGWRLSHRQAKAAMAVVQRGAEQKARYVDVALLASALHDEVLANSLRQIYLAPLEQGRDGGATLRETLHAYFAAGRNASSTAVSLGVSRKTVSIRLRSVGEKLGGPVEGCAAELETALKLRGLDQRAPQGR